MKFILKFFILITVLTGIGCGNVQDEEVVVDITSSADDYSSKIDDLLLSINPRPFNGVILITQNGKTVYSNAYGFSNFKVNTPIRLSDKFRIQSNSKQVTAVLVLREYEKGNIKLHNPIREYLPELEQDWADRVNVHQLLNMSSGIINLDDDLIFEPGMDYRYSNAGYTLLGKILENVSGERYIDLANNLFEELSMHNSFCYEFDGDQNGLINGYIRANDGYERVDFYSRGITTEGWMDFIPAGGIISNAIDLNVWDKKLHNGKILKAETYDLMTNFSIQGQHIAFGDKKIGYGYGVRIDDHKHTKVIGHAGKGIGFANIKFYAPAKDLSVIVLENVYDDDPNIVYHFERAILDVVMNSSLVN